MELDNIILVIIGALLFIGFISLFCSIMSYMINRNTIVVTKASSVIPMEGDENAVDKDIETCLETVS